MKTGSTNSRAFKREISSGSLESRYLFLGEEEGEKEKVIYQLIERHLGKEYDMEYSVRRFHLENGELLQAADFALSQSMFTSKKVSVMMNIHQVPVHNKNQLLLEEMLENVSEEYMLIFTSPENRMPGILNTKIVKSIRVIHFWRLFERDLYDYIIRTLREQGIVIDDRSVFLMVEFLGRDVRNIDNALEKIILSGEKIIGPDVLKNQIQFEREITVFDFVDALFIKNRMALKLLQGMLEEGISELFILGMVARQAELLERYYWFTHLGEDQANIFQKLRITEKGREGFIKQADVWGRERLKHLFSRIYEAEDKLKSYRPSKNILSNPVYDLSAGMLTVQ